MVFQTGDHFLQIAASPLHRMDRCLYLYAPRSHRIVGVGYFEDDEIYESIASRSTLAQLAVLADQVVPIGNAGLVAFEFVRAFAAVRTSSRMVICGFTLVLGLGWLFSSWVPSLWSLSLALVLAVSWRFIL